jgi:hypothetical protein
MIHNDDNILFADSSEDELQRKLPDNWEVNRKRAMFHSTSCEVFVLNGDAYSIGIQNKFYKIVKKEYKFNDKNESLQGRKPFVGGRYRG